MKGNPKLIQTLNALLADELGGISQYMVHSEMCANWGYEKLHKHFEMRAREEMKHAERLIGRILFLEGIPDVQAPAVTAIGAEVPAMLKNDLASEVGAVKKYNDAISQAGEVHDFATREILEEILSDEDRHVDEIEERLDQIGHMTLGIFLATQTG